MASSDYSEVMLLDSSQPYLLAQRILLFICLLIEEYHFVNLIIVVSHVDELYAVW